MGPWLKLLCSLRGLIIPLIVCRLASCPATLEVASDYCKRLLQPCVLRFNGEKKTWDFYETCVSGLKWDEHWKFFRLWGRRMLVFHSRQDTFPLLSPRLLLSRRDLLQHASS